MTTSRQRETAVVRCLVARGLFAASLALTGPVAAAPATQDITFDDIKFEHRKGTPFRRSLLSDKIERLHGQRIRIRGYILPSYQQDGITQFVLVRDNRECCFGPGAALYDCIFVEMAAGKSISYTVRPVAVEGIFRIKPFLDPDGKTLAVYHLEGISVR